MLSRVSAYVLAGIPAAIGVVFVARYAFVTSDTDIDGAANAFLFGMIAAGAFAGPACAIAVGRNGRTAAAILLGILAGLAIVANWTHTLGAIAHRGAGIEAQAAKARADAANARAELERLTAERAAMTFRPTTVEAVAAAQAAVGSAERARAAECGDGDPRQRGSNCRKREEGEQAARDALAAVLADKASADAASRLEEAARALRAKLESAAPVKDSNTLGEALARVLPFSGATAATVQQGLVSAIAELLIAAALALPELLRRDQPAAARAEATTNPDDDRQTQASAQAAGHPSEVANAPEGETAQAVGKGSVVEFMLACLPRKRGKQVAITSIYARYARWCTERQPRLSPIEPEPFVEQFKALCERAGVQTERRGRKTYCLDVQLVA